MQIFKLMLISSILCAFALSVNAQGAALQTVPAAHTGEHKLPLPNIEKQHYPNFRNIHTLTQYTNVTYAGLDSSSTQLTRYQLVGTSDNIKLKALYNKNGTLVKSLLVKKNTKLPMLIYQSLAPQFTANWSMVSNKTIVINFDPNLTQYRVVLQVGDKQQTLYFNSYGARIDGLTDLPRFASFGEDNLALAR